MFLNIYKLMKSLLDVHVYDEARIRTVFLWVLHICTQLTKVNFEEKRVLFYCHAVLFNVFNWILKLNMLLWAIKTIYKWFGPLCE